MSARTSSLPPFDASGSTQRWVPDHRYSIVVVIMVAVQLYTMIVPEHLGEDTDFGAGGGGIYRLCKLGLLVCGALLLMWRASLTWLLTRHVNVFLLVFLALAGMSTAWSIEPKITMMRTFNLISIMSVCMALGLVSWRRTRFQDLVRPMLTLLLLGSIILAVTIPRIGLEEGTSFELRGSWRGLTYQKNALGHLASFGVILWLHAWLSREVKLSRALIGGGIAAVALLGSRSSTSILATGFTAMFLLLLLRLPQNTRRYMPYVIGAFAILVLTYSLAVLRVVPGLDALLTPIASITGKDTTFSNRSVIWSIIVEHVRLAPWLGSGYGAYWIGPFPNSPSFVFLSKMFFYPTQSHNGYLENINDLGYVGLMCLLGFLFVYIRQALTLLKADRCQGALFLGLFFLQAIANLSEANWFQSTSFEFVIMSMSTIALGRALLELKLREYYGTPGIARADRRRRDRPVLRQATRSASLPKP